MPTQEAKAHHVGEWASLRNTSILQQLISENRYHLQ